MKKLLWFPLLTLTAFLFLPSSALAFTPEYQELEVFVEELVSTDTPISSEDRVRLESQLSLAAERASWSVSTFYEQETIKTEHAYQIKQERLMRKFQAQNRKAQKAINRWYKKNRSQPGAERERLRRLAKAQIIITERYNSAMELLGEKTLSRIKDLQYEDMLYAERIVALAERGFVAIDKRPSIV